MRIICTLLAVAALVFADEVMLNDGNIVEGKIVETTDQGITVEIDTAGSEGKVEIKKDELDPIYYYTKRSESVGDDAKGRLKLAVYAFENGMFNRARVQYNKALLKDAKLVEEFERDIVPKIKEGVAMKLLGAADRAMQSGDLIQAERRAAKILTSLYDTKAAEDARKLIDKLHSEELRRDLRKREARFAQIRREEERKQESEARKRMTLLEPIEKRIESGRTVNLRGLKKSQMSQAKNDFNQAVKHFENAIKRADAVIKQAADDPKTVAEATALREVAVREAIDSHVNAANVYMIRRAYKDALTEVNQALALDPESDYAKRARAQVVQDAQRRTGWRR